MENSARDHPISNGTTPQCATACGTYDSENSNICTDDICTEDAAVFLIHILTRKTFIKRSQIKSWGVESP